MTDVFIYGDIGEPARDKPRVSASAVLDQIRAIDPAERLNVRINSNGGSVTHATAIYNAIKGHPGGADTQVDGIAASAAAYIAMAGEKRRMAGNAMMMIHHASGAVEGNAEEMRRAADVIEQFSNTIVPAFASRTGKTREQMSEMMRQDKYMTASEALALGFVDEITGDLAVAACIRIDTSEYHMSEPLVVTAEEKTLLKRLSDFFTPTPADPVAQVKADLITAKASLVEVRAERDAEVAKVVALTKERDEAIAKIETPEARESAISAEVTKRIAASGTNPIKRDPKAAESETLTAEAFRALEPLAQRAFCVKGGKIAG